MRGKKGENSVKVKAVRKKKANAHTCILAKGVMKQENITNKSYARVLYE